MFELTVKKCLLGYSNVSSEYAENQTLVCRIYVKVLNCNDFLQAVYIFRNTSFHAGLSLKHYPRQSEEKT